MNDGCKIMWGLRLMVVLIGLGGCDALVKVGRSIPDDDESAANLPAPGLPEIPAENPAEPVLLPVPNDGLVQFTASSVAFPNPERGFYAWSGSDFVSDFDGSSVQSAYDEGWRLVLALVHLDAYRATDLPESFLIGLGQSFELLRSAGMKATLLFSYDFSAGGNDASALQIKRHLEQLKPVLAQHADLIPFMRAGFIGAWGEWHSSKAGNSCGYNSGTTSCDVADANRIVVRDALLANVPNSTQIQFRYPGDLIKWFPQAEQHPAQVGFHNDCFQAGPTDTGTYQTQAQRDYIKLFTGTAAFGGENCINGEMPVRQGCSDILAEGPAYHLTWLNVSDWSGFISAWKNGGCFEQVAGFMGYRIQLDSLSFRTRLLSGEVSTWAVRLRNLGWSRLFSPRSLSLTLRHQQTGEKLEFKAGDLSSLPAQAVDSSEIVFSVSGNIPVGVYDAFLSSPDVFSRTAADSRFALRFANADDSTKGQSYLTASGMFNLGISVSVE